MNITVEDREIIIATIEEYVLIYSGITGSPVFEETGTCDVSKVNYMSLVISARTV